MKNQLRFGKWKYISFIIMDLLCLVIANFIAIKLYLKFGEHPYNITNNLVCVEYMVVIDVFVTFAFGTLNEVLRRRKRKESIVSLKHVIISFVSLTLFLFSTKQSASFSRITIYLTYIIYYFLLGLFRIILKEIFKALKSAKNISNVMLITTTGYVSEGLVIIGNAGINIKGLFLTDKTNDGVIDNIPVIVDSEMAKAFLCWSWVDKVYICGPENMDVPEVIIGACNHMGILICNVPVNKRFDYKIVKINTVLQEDNETGLSFFESEQDIPFRINRLYTIFKQEEDAQRGFYVYKQSWHMFICPYGEINIYIDTGKEKKNILLSRPSEGLILHPSVWREITWKMPESVLCVVASGHYDSGKLNVNHDDYIKFLQGREWAAVLESAEFMGETIK